MKFILNGQIVPKARPRVNRGRAILPQRYRAWKNAAIVELIAQRTCYESIEKAQVAIILHGKHHRKKDADNLAGAILDALVQAEIIKDDSLMVVTKLTIQLEWSKQEPIAIVEVIEVEFN